jgi:hypothetical protein
MTLVIHGVSLGDLEVEWREDLTIVDLHRAKAGGDYNGDGNFDVYVAEGAKEQLGGTLRCEMTCPFTTPPSLSQGSHRFAPLV